MVGTVNMLVTRCRSTSRQASAQSSRSPDSSTVAAPRATCDSACTPAPCDSGATTSDTSCSVVPGIRSHRWLQMTYSIWPCVNTPAFGRPVVPEV